MLFLVSGSVCCYCKSEIIELCENIPFFWVVIKWARAFIVAFATIKDCGLEPQRAIKTKPNHIPEEEEKEEQEVVEVEGGGKNWK